MRLLDSRRLTGPSLVLDRPGAIAEVALDGTDPAPIIGGWARTARQLLDAVGWSGEIVRARSYPGGASLAISAPIDALYSATEVNESAWAATEADATGIDPAVVARLRGAIATERNPALIALADAAHANGVSLLVGEELVTLGLGAGGRSWRVDALPSADAVPWAEIRDVPVALVTGSNGKTTTVRLTAAMLEAAGCRTGIATTEGVVVAGEMVEEDDFSGPQGARLALRDPRTEAAVLETARGGILRRGLAVRRPAVAVVTNVAADHVGEYGVHDLAGLADTKMVVARAVPAGGRVVLNADDPLLVERAADLVAPITWFSLAGRAALGAVRMRPRDDALVVEGDEIVRIIGATAGAIAAVADLPLAHGGRAHYNVANALAAAAAGFGLGVPPAVVGRVLTRFGASPRDNPGRANLIDVGGIQVLLDYAHNPAGLREIVALAADLRATRRLIMLGQAGDRDDTAIRALAREALALRPDRVILKELERYRRGRQPGEVPALLQDELVRAGFPESAIRRAPDDPAGARDALAWARDGDLLVLLVHTDRARILDLLETLERAGWRAGEPLPPG